MLAHLTEFSNMPSCPRCGKKFKDDSRVLNHMNQPAASCLTYYQEILQINETLKRQQEEHPPTATPPTLSEENEQDPIYNPSMEHNTLQAEINSNFNQHDPPHPREEDDHIPPSKSQSYFKEPYPGASKVYGNLPTFMDLFECDIHASKRQTHLYYPFASKDEWELASFLLRSDLSMSVIDKFLKLKLVRYLDIQGRLL